MNEDWKKIFENQPPVPCSFVSNMDDSGYDENAVLFFEETGALGEAYRLYKINDFKDGRDTLVIPSEVNGKPVVEIGEHAGWNLHIRNLYLPKSVKNIGNSAFTYKEFDVLVIDGVEQIGKYAFHGMIADTLILSDGIKEIGEWAFWTCGINSVILPGSIETIGNWAFADNYLLKSIKFEEGIKEIGEHAFDFCNGLTGLEFPDSLEKIHSKAFKSCWNIKKIKFGNNLKTIDISAFADCWSLREIDFGDAPVKAYINAFDSCEKLRRVTIGKNCRYISELAFSDCYSLIEICNKSDYRIEISEAPKFENLPKDRKTLYFPLVKNVCKDESESCLKQTEDGFVFFEKDGEKVLVSYEGDGGRVEIPEGTTAIWNYAFYDNHTTEEVIVPYTVKTIGHSAFNHCSLKSIQLCCWFDDFGDGDLCDYAQLETICDYAFANSHIERIEIPDSVRYVGKGAFCDSSVKDVVWGEGCQNILYGTFENCEAIENIDLSKTRVQFIDDYAFENCKALKRITLPKRIVRVSPTAFWKSKPLILAHDRTLYNLPEIPDGILADIISDHQ